MATQDVPGANPANHDTLAVGNWAEHSDGSLIFVQGTENGRVVFQLYDVAQMPPVYYQDAMTDVDFKAAFSFPPVGKSAEKWTWHNRTPMPWSRVMKGFDKPVPMHADVGDQLTAASRVAESLKLRAQRLYPDGVEHMADREAVGRAPRTIRDRIQGAVNALFGD